MAILDVLDILLLGTGCEDLASALRKRAHRVFPISRAEAATAMLSVRAFDIVIVSHQPIDMTAWEAVGRLRGLVSAAASPIVVCDDGQADIAGLRAAGADHVLASSDVLVWLDGQVGGGAEESSDPEAGVAPVQSDSGRELLGMLGETLRQQLAALSPERFQPAHLPDIAHRLKGSAANFGYASLGQVAAEAMRDADEPDKIGELVARLVYEIEQSMKDINRRLAQASK